MPIKHVLFDIDDTLFPSSEFAENARKNAVRAMREMGLRQSQERIYSELLKIIKKYGSNYSAHFDELCKRLKIKRPAKYIAAAVAAYHNTKTSILPYQEVPRMLMKLRADGYKIYVATNGDAIKQWDKLIRLDIEHYFDDVFVSQELGMEKSKKYFEKIARMITAKPDECLMVGDREEYDVRPAKAIGMKAARILRGRYLDKKSAADIILRNLKTLPTTIKKL